jgi:hypothetical protein
MIEWFRPDSDAVDLAGYDAGRRELHLVFAGGRHYAYRPVSADLFVELLSSESIGQFVNLQIKPYFDVREDRPVRVRSDWRAHARSGGDLADRGRDRSGQVGSGVKARH